MFKGLSKISGKQLLTNIKKKTFRMIIMGNTESGKSWFVKRILLPKIIKQFKYVILFTREYNISSYTLSLKKMEFDMDNFKALSYDNATSKNQEIMKDIQEIKNKQKDAKTGEDDEGEPTYDSVLIIFDDIIDENLMTREDFLELFFNFRHYNMSVMMISQVTNGAISPRMKSNIEYNIFFRLNNDLQRAYPYNILYNAIKLQRGKLSQLKEKSLSAYVEDLYMRWTFEDQVDGKSKWQYIIVDNKGNIFGEI